MTDKLVSFAPSDAHKAIFDAAIAKSYPILANLFGVFLGHCESNGLPSKVSVAALNQWLFSSLCKLTLASCDVPEKSVPRDVPGEIGLAMQAHLLILLMEAMKDIRQREASGN